MNSRLFTWHWIYREIHIPNNPVAFVVCHLVHRQFVEKFGMVRQRREDRLTKERSSILPDNSDIVRGTIVTANQAGQSYSW
jgi:hypothetical protein